MAKPRHTAECAEIASLIALTTKALHANRGRGEIPHYLAEAASSLGGAHLLAHRACGVIARLSDKAARAR